MQYTYNVMNGLKISRFQRIAGTRRQPGLLRGLRGGQRRSDVNGCVQWSDVHRIFSCFSWGGAGSFRGVSENQGL